MEAAVIVDRGSLLQNRSDGFFGGVVTSQSPFRAVAVWAKISLLIHFDGVADVVSEARNY
jgi:hypothetical protein